MRTDGLNIYFNRGKKKQMFYCKESGTQINIYASLNLIGSDVSINDLIKY